MRLFLILVFAMLLWSCADLEPVEVEAYFDVDSVVNAQYELLKKTDYPIRKIAWINGRADTSFMEPEDSTRWSYELGVFRKANINKPVLRGAYEVKKEKLPDGRSIIYEPKEPEKRTVKHLEIVYQGEDLREIHARINDSNPIYGSERSLTMLFKSLDGQNRLMEYQIDGAQKMILKDTVTLRVNSEILYDSK